MVTGSTVDTNYFKLNASWTLNGEKLSVVDDNEHVRLIASGLSEVIEITVSAATVFIPY